MFEDIFAAQDAAEAEFMRQFDALQKLAEEEPNLSVTDLLQAIVGA